MSSELMGFARSFLRRFQHGGTVSSFALRSAEGKTMSERARKKKNPGLSRKTGQTVQKSRNRAKTPRKRTQRDIFTSSECQKEYFYPQNTRNYYGFCTQRDIFCPYRYKERDIFKNIPRLKKKSEKPHKTYANALVYFFEK